MLVAACTSVADAVLSVSDPNAIIIAGNVAPAPADIRSAKKISSLPARFRETVISSDVLFLYFFFFGARTGGSPVLPNADPDQIPPEQILRASEGQPGLPDCRPSRLDDSQCTSESEHPDSD